MHVIHDARCDALGLPRVARLVHEIVAAPKKGKKEGRKETRVSFW
jgi:hypothetical protein